MSAGQVRRLLGYAEMGGRFQRTRDTKYFEYAPRLNRDLVRTWRGRNQEERKARDWAARLATPAGMAEMPAMGFVCRYALAANRG